MKNLDLNAYGVQEMNRNAVVQINGGGTAGNYNGNVSSEMIKGSQTVGGYIVGFIAGFFGF